MKEWLKEWKSLIITFIGSLTILAIIPLFDSIYLDQYIMLLTLFGLLVNNLGKESLLYQIRKSLSEIFIFLAKSVFKALNKIAIVFLFSIVITTIFYVLDSLGLYITNIPKVFSTNHISVLSIYVISLIVIFIASYKISESVKNIEEDCERKEKLAATIYYAFIFTVYGINFVIKLCK